VDYSGALIDDNTDDAVLEAIAAAAALEATREHMELPDLDDEDED
jgi:hypothetical protein